MDLPRTIVRKAARHELAALIEVERRSSVRFAAVAGLESWADDTTDLDELVPAVEAELVWAAEADGGELVGWCYASVADDSLFVEQIDVLPEFGRQGIGRRILAAVGDEAAARGLLAVTLTTDAHVPWNQPWYESIGFVVVGPEAQAPGLAAHIAAEAARGFDMARRVAMRRAHVVRTPG